MNLEFSKYMNPPECSVSVGDVCIRTDENCENPYTVKEIVERNGKFWAVCSHEDEFSGDIEEVEVYHFYLKKQTG